VFGDSVVVGLELVFEENAEVEVQGKVGPKCRGAGVW
jgi:hypothetical protein